MAKKEKTLQLASVDKWTDKKGKEIPMKDMDDVYLQRAKFYAQRRELYFFNRAGVFTELVEKLEKEASSRGIELDDLNTDYHKNNKILRNAMTKS